MTTGWYLSELRYVLLPEAFTNISIHFSLCCHHPEDTFLPSTVPFDACKDSTIPQIESSSVSPGGGRNCYTNKSLLLSALLKNFLVGAALHLKSPPYQGNGAPARHFKLGKTVLLSRQVNQIIIGSN